MSSKTILTIIKGSDRILKPRIKKKSDGLPYDLTGATEITATFCNEDGTLLEKSLSDADGSIEVLSAEGGQVQVKLLAADTALLKAGEKESFKLTVTDSADEISITKYKRSLNVEEADLDC